MINYKITEKNYELIRNRVGAILTAEFARQAANFYNEDCEDVTFFVERTIPVQTTEFSVGIVSMAAGKFDKHYQGGMDGHYKVTVQFFTLSKARTSQRPDALALYKNQRIMGIAIAILSDPIYKTLGFDPGFIQGVRVDTFNMVESDQHEDNLSVAQGIIVVDIDAAEEVELPDGVPFEANYTDVVLEETGLGYQFIYSTKPVYNPYAQAFFNECSVEPNAEIKQVISDTFDALGSDVTKHDGIWISASQHEDNALINIVNPTATKSTKIGSPDFLNFRGFIGGAGKAINRNFNPAIDAVNYTATSGSFWVLATLPEFTTGGGTGVIAGAANAGSVGATGIALNNNPGILGGVNSSGLPFGEDPISDKGKFQGLHHFVLSGGTLKYYRNGLLISSNAVGSQPILSVSITELAYSINGTLFFEYTPGEVAAMGIGSADISPTNLYDAIMNKYYAALPMYVGVGDSIIYGTGATNPATENALRLVADNAEKYFYNHGIPGQTTTTFLSSKSWGRPNSNPYNKLFLDEGLNDSVFVSVPQYKTNVQAMIDMAVANGWSKHQIHYVYAFDASDGPGFDASNYTNNFIPAIEEVLNANPTVKRIDLRNITGYGRADYIHPNTAGYAAIANYINSLLS